MNRSFLVAAVATLSVWFSADCAQAQWGWQGYPTWYARNVYSVYDQDRLPYFSLHPPVYYSYPVPRTYGYSPFAYPEYVMTPEIAATESEIIVNPYYDQAPTTDSPKARTPAPKIAPPTRQPMSLPNKRTTVKPGADRSAAVSPVKPLRIANPYAPTGFAAAGSR